MSKANPDFSLHTGASGGGQLGRVREFMKEPDPQKEQGMNAMKRQDKVAAGERLNTNLQSGEDEFRTGKSVKQEYTTSTKAKSAVRTGDKSLPAIKPKG